MGANHCLLIVMIGILSLIGPSRFSFSKQKLYGVVFRGVILLTTEIRRCTKTALNGRAWYGMEWKTIFPYSILAIFFHSISMPY